MTAEEKCIIEELLGGCSPTVQRIVNTENKFSIPAQSDEETDGIEEDSNEAIYMASQDIDNASQRDGQLKLCLAQQLSPSSEDNKLTVGSQEILTPFDNLEFEDVSPEMPTHFDIKEHEDVSEEFPIIFDILEVEEFSQETTAFDIQESELEFSGESKRKSQYYTFSPLKLIVDKLLMLHNDGYPNKICPGLNRSPSLIGLGDKIDGLVSRQHSPKLDIPLQYYSGHKTQQHHPLMRYKKADHPSVHNEMAEQQRRDGSVAETLTNKLEDNMLESKQALKKPSRFKKFTSYLERKLHFSKKKEVLPPIGCKSAAIIVN